MCIRDREHSFAKSVKFIMRSLTMLVEHSAEGGAGSQEEFQRVWLHHLSQTDGGITSLLDGIRLNVESSQLHCVRVTEEVLMLRERLLAKQHGTAKNVIELQSELALSHERNEQLRLELQAKTAQIDADRREHAGKVELVAAQLQQGHEEAQKAIYEKINRSSAQYDEKLQAEREGQEVLKQGMIKLANENQGMIAELDTLRNENEALSEAAASSRRELEAKFSNREGQYASESQLREKSISQERTTREQLEDELVCCQNELAAVKLRLTEIEGQHRETGSESASALQQLQQRYDSLLLSTQSNQSSQSELSQLVQHLRLQLNDEQLMHTQAMHGLRSQRDQVAEDCKRLELDKQQSSSTIIDLQQSLADLQHSTERTLANEALRRQMLEGNVHELQGQNRTLEERLAGAQEELRRLNALLADEQRKAHQAASEWCQKEAQMHSQVDAYRNQLSSVESELSASRDQLSRKRAELQDSCYLAEQTQISLDECRASLRQLKADLDRALHQTSVVTQELEAEGARYLLLHQKHAMYVCISIYTLYIQLMRMSSFKRWREWCDDRVLQAGADELAAITESAVSPKSYSAAREFENFDPDEFDVCRIVNVIHACSVFLYMSMWCVTLVLR
eukprot:TRINITY_DN22056_c0_g1_i1.p1 TRINITY_DN22056_c0_g1~~TRINITY_DN22056_c0_g1_i1.p1  ORF type:complete len:625 (-),score=205.88 TRINITY_DN22056_c0_g1_i1:123-1997(-)